MSDSTHPSTLDFHAPRQPNTQALRQLSAWQTNVCAHIQEAWASLLAQPIQMTPGKIEPVQFQTALSRLPEDGLGVYFSIGETLLPAMMTFSARQVQGLIADLLDLPGDAWPDPKPLTAAEDSMLELLFQKVAEAMGEAWPETQPIKCNFLETTAKPRRTRLFPMGSPLFSVPIQIYSRFGTDTCHWLMLKEETERLVEDLVPDFEPEQRGQHPDLEALTQKVPLEVKVELGKVELTMSQATALEVGDVLILDQLVSQPLIASVHGCPKWAGVPMRIGSRQAFEVTHVLDDVSLSSLLNVSGSQD